VLEIIEKESLVEAAARQGTLLRSRLEEALGGRVIDIRGKGLLVGIELDADPKAVVSAARAQGLLVYPAAIGAILLGPPLIITEPEIDQLVDRLTAALDET
jgi:acetylornithine/succinyldiaminopimelate/putrescine aminotransferase